MNPVKMVVDLSATTKNQKTYTLYLTNSTCPQMRTSASFQSCFFTAPIIYSGNPLYPQKAKSFILTYFLFQGILGLPSRSWLALSFFFLISRYSSIFKAFSMVLSKRKRPHRTVFPLYKVFIFSLFYSFPRLKIFVP